MTSRPSFSNSALFMVTMPGLLFPLRLFLPILWSVPDCCSSSLLLSSLLSCSDRSNSEVIPSLPKPCTVDSISLKTSSPGNRLSCLDISSARGLFNFLTIRLSELLPNAICFKYAITSLSLSCSITALLRRDSSFSMRSAIF